MGQVTRPAQGGTLVEIRLPEGANLVDISAQEGGKGVVTDTYAAQGINEHHAAQAMALAAVPPGAIRGGVPIVVGTRRDRKATTCRPR